MTAVEREPEVKERVELTAEAAGGREQGPPVARLIGGSPVRLWGMTAAERLRRLLARAGVADVAAWDGTAAAGRPHLLIRGDHVFAAALIPDLLARPGAVLLHEERPVAAHVDAGAAGRVAEAMDAGRLPDASGLELLEPHALGSPHDPALRKRSVPYVLRLTPASLDEAERRTFDGSYKGVTDFVTRHVWPAPARRVTRWCAEAGVTPNMVTMASLGLVLLAFWLFWIGAFLPGLVAAWAMTFLDTVDGKLARVTVTSSRLGNAFDHGIDLIHPPFWYWAWAAGVWSAGGAPAGLDMALAVTVAGYVVQRLQEGLFLGLFKMEIHVWRRFDSLFRLVVARRNPNLALLTLFALFGAPGAGLIAVAVWTGVSLVVHTAQIVQAARAPAPLRSWLAA
ncbi:MAG TPA: CDP-alcohol phosphatidyltransferase family protein [Thermohalobaculum sp.]|nr:CDP-alcohol phosphatidyltransferase family protein [Thermohalobaculum sp.]